MVNLFLQGIFWAWNNSAEIAQLGERQTEIFWKLFQEYLAHTLYAEFVFSVNVKKFSKHFVEDKMNELNSAFIKRINDLEQVVF